MTKKLEAEKRKKCSFLYDEKGEQIPIPEMNEKIFCIPDRKGRPLYYILDRATGELKFVGYQKLMNICTETSAEKRKVLIDKCLDRAAVRRFSDDIGYIREFLTYFENVGGIEPCILDFFEQLSLFTTMSFDDFLQIMGGAYVVLKGDGGDVFRKFLKCEKDKFQSVNVSWLPKRFLGFELPSILSKDFVPMSSHDKYMTDAFRMGAGNLVMCDLEEKYKSEGALKNPKFDILVGRSIDPRFDGDTAFQLESCRMDNFKNFVLHGLVFFKYKWVRKNVGAFGYSVYTDREPLVIKTCKGQICPRFISNM